MYTKLKKVIIFLLMISLNLSFFPVASISAASKEGNLDSARELQKRVDVSNNLNMQESSLSTGEIETLKVEKSDISKIQNRSLSLENEMEKNNKQEKQGYVPGEILVKFKKSKINLESSAGLNQARQFSANKSLDKKEDLRKNNISVLKIKDSKTVEQKIAELKNDPNVESVQPNFQYYPLSIDTNDTYKDNLWGLDNTGQTVGGTYTTNNPGSADKDIDASKAWAINEGMNNSVIVAVIDDGVAYNHPDLLPNMWNGSNCVGSDKNGNPLSGGCLHGYDYEDDDLVPLPTSGSHGTHIAGTIAAVKNNSKGIIGVASRAKIMAIKSSLTTANVVKSINFAQQNGAKVINASWGDVFTDGAYIHYFLDDALYNAIDNFSGLFIAAAGNDMQNHDSGNTDTKMYPAAFDLDNIISVAATDQNDDLADFSDYGATSVDVGAPGVNIYSTISGYYYSDVLDESFESTLPPNIPSDWQKNGYWGTYELGEPWGKVLYGDYSNLPYANNVDSTITLSSYNLSDIEKATIDFWTRCDTEYVTTDWYDYMALEISGDGVNYEEYFKWDEATLDFKNNESPLNDSGPSVFNFQGIEIPSSYLTNNFKLRFRWHTDSSNVPDIDYDGCLIDDIKITKYFYSDGSDEKYEFYNGTSMAAPHVAGLAALIDGYNPNLTYTQVKDIILTTGDPIADLNPVTGGHPILTGKRINAYNALLKANPVKAITSFSFSEGTGIVDEDAHTIAVTVPFGTDVTSLVPTIAISTGATVSPASGVAQDFTSPVTYTVTAADSSIQTYVVTVSVIDDTAPTLLPVTPVPTPTNDNTPDYIFNSDEAGIIAYSGGCTSATTDANVGDNTITFNSLAEGTYDSCSLTVTDVSSNESTSLSVSTFVIDNTAPVINLTGDEVVELIVGDTYSEDGATATDVVDGPIAPVVIGGDTVDNQTIGTYIVTYNISDSAGNTADEVIRTVNVVEAPDETAPVLSGITPVPTPATDNTPSYTFSTDEAGTISYGGDCSSAKTNAVIGNNEITFDSLTEGTYSNCTITVTDSSNNASIPLAINTFTIDNTAPTINLTGDAVIDVEFGNVYVDEGATANDNVDGDISGQIVQGGDVIDWQTVGTYVRTFNVTDIAGNVATEVTRTVNVNDNESPVITINGEVEVTVQVNSDYTDAGATATDNYDTSVTVNDDSVNVDTSTIGTYIITYTASDSSENDATPVTRTVIVEDTEAPVIALIDDSTIYVEVGNPYNDAGATATDNYDISVTVNDDSNNVNISVLDTYTVTYTATDSSGNIATPAIRTVIVRDTTAPVIAMDGVNPKTVVINTSYDDAGATATDNYDNSVTVISNSNVNSSVVGEYTVTYNAIDSSNNSAQEITRIVFVVDITTPIITLLGDNPMNIEVNTPYVEPGYAAIDNVDGDISDNVAVTGSVDNATVGNYILEYNVSDSSNNDAPTVSRTVLVEDTTAPVISLTGDNPVNVEIGYEYNDAGATVNDNYDGDISDQIITVSNVDIDTEGTYQVTYNAVDDNGNPADEVIRIVNVGPDVTPPVITLISSSTIDIYIGDNYTDEGATAIDNVDDNITSSIVITGLPIDNTATGTHIITYNVSDVAGNPADEVTRTVNVNEDTLPPVRDNGLPIGELTSGVTQATLSLITDEDAVCRYAITTDVDFGIMTGIFDTTGSTTHSTLITGLTDGNSYSYYVKCEDGLDNANIDDYEITFSIAQPPSGGGGGGSSSADTSAPTNVSVIINSEAATTTSKTVTLTLSASDSSNIQMAISNNSTFSGGSWEDYSVTKSWLLTGENGVKTVYVKFKDTAGNISSSVQDTIILSASASDEAEKAEEGVKVLGIKLDITNDVNYIIEETIKKEKEAMSEIDINLSKRVSGRILLQVEEHGEAWYVNPKGNNKYYMANGDKAYGIMRYLSVGITNKDLERVMNDKEFAKKHSGKIFLQVEEHGEAYYIDIDGNAHYLKDGAAAYTIMRELGLGITNNDLRKVEIGEIKEAE